MWMLFKEITKENFEDCMGLGSGTTGDSMIVRLNGIVYGLSVIITPIILLLGFKLMCEIVYKIVKAAEIIIEDNKNK